MAGKLANFVESFGQQFLGRQRGQAGESGAETLRAEDFAVAAFFLDQTVRVQDEQVVRGEGPVAGTKDGLAEQAEGGAFFPPAS